MTNQLAPVGIQRFFDNAGFPAIGGTVYTYEAGTTTPAATYTDSTGNTLNTNPIILNTRGEASIWLTQGQYYKLAVYDSLGNLLQTVDQVSSDAGVFKALADYYASLAAGTGATLLGFQQGGTGSVPTTVAAELSRTITPQQFGAKGDGVNDDTLAIQAAVNFAASMFNQVGFPPAGAVYTPPTVFFPPGCYRITNTINVFVGLTVIGTPLAFTVEATRVVMDTAIGVGGVGGATRLNLPCFSVTGTFNGAFRSTYNGSITDLGFWILNPGATINARGGRAWNAGEGTSSCISVAENCIDARIKRCNFYSSPVAGVSFSNASGATTFDAEISDNEFDTTTVAIAGTGGAPNLRLLRNQYYGNSYVVQWVNPTGGKITVQGGLSQLYGRFSIASNVAGVGLDELTIIGLPSDGAGGQGDYIATQNVKRVTINGSTIGTTAGSGIFLTNTDSGSISGNLLYNVGYNATVNPSDPTQDPGAIKLVGSAAVVVGANSITTPATDGSFGGFGIGTFDATGRPSNDVIADNFISERYNGTGYRGQTRRLNTAAGDTLGVNKFGSGVGAEPRQAFTDAGVLYTVQRTAMPTAGTIGIPLYTLSSAKVLLTLSMNNTATSLSLEVLIAQLANSGAYSIMNVSKNGVAGAGLGPHAVTTGNTVTLSISGNTLDVTFAYTTDSMLYSVTMEGAK